MFVNERTKCESFENTMARAAKEITSEKRAAKHSREEIDILKHKNEKLTNERDEVQKSAKIQNKNLTDVTNRCAEMEREILDAVFYEVQNFALFSSRGLQKFTAILWVIF